MRTLSKTFSSQQIFFRSSFLWVWTFNWLIQEIRLLLILMYACVLFAVFHMNRYVYSYQKCVAYYCKPKRNCVLILKRNFNSMQSLLQMCHYLFESVTQRNVTAVNIKEENKKKMEYLRFWHMQANIVRNIQRNLSRLNILPFCTHPPNTCVSLRKSIAATKVLMIM